MKQRHAIVRAFWRTFPALAFFALSCANTFAQSPQAILVDGPGPWRDDRWAMTVTEFTSLLQEAGYSIRTVAPENVSAAVFSAPEGFLLAVPSLESLPISVLSVLNIFSSRSGGLMASGGEPFRNPLYFTPDGRWLNAADYEAATGSPPTPIVRVRPPLRTISPAGEQYVDSAGRRLPIVRQRALYSASGGRMRVIGDVLAPAATVYSEMNVGFGPFPTQSEVIVWLPSPRLPEPHRTELVAALRAAAGGVHLQTAGPSSPAWLTGETIAGEVSVSNMGNAPAVATLHWTISGGVGTLQQPPVPIPIPARRITSFPLTFPSLPAGQYTLHARLLIDGREVDRADTPFRVLDPAASRRPEQKIKVQDGAFHAAGKEVFLHGVNYWPRYAATNTSWMGFSYDPEQVEADLALLESLHFNLINIRYVDARTIMDFLERCRNHNIWVRIELPATQGNNAFAGTLNPDLGKLLTSAYLPGNDRVFAYELLWEPYIGMQKSGGYNGYLNGLPIRQGEGRAALDGEWRAWVAEQYGSLDAARQAWGVDPPLNDGGQLTNPTDAQFTTDGEWRIFVAAYRRFLDDYLGRNLGLVAREIRRADPETLVAYRHWSAMSAFGNENTNYDAGTGAAHIDFLSLESYEINQWPELRKMGLATAYSRYRSGGKPVQWVEYGYNMGSAVNAVTLAAQTRYCEDFMRLVEDDGSNGNTIWWWPGGVPAVSNSDFGIIQPDGTPRGCALVLAEAGERFAESPPRIGDGPGAVFQVDRDADARGQHGLFLKWADEYAAKRASGESVRLTDAGLGTNTATMPRVQVGNIPYAGAGPLKYANAEFGGIRVVCPGVDAVVENGASIQVPPGAACRITPAVVNTGEAEWLPSTFAAGGVTLHTSAGDAAVVAPLAPLRKTELPSLDVTMQQASLPITGRMRIGGVGDFGEALRLTLTVDANSANCSATLNPAGRLNVSADGGSAAIGIVTGADCSWTAASLQPWVTFAPGSGMGSGQVTYNVARNSGPARETGVTVAGRSFTVVQDGAVATSGPQPIVGPNGLHFGSQTVGTPGSAQTVTVTNPTSSAIGVVLIGIGGTNSADFTQSNTCGTSLAAGASCSISVTFTPSTSGPRSAALFAGASSVALTGTGAGTGPKPAIQAIADVWTYSPGLAPGHWVTIGGTNLAAYPQIANLGASDLLPTRLDDVSVTFNGAPAVLSYAGPSQINALIPASIQPGPVSVVVDVGGVASDPFPAMAKATQPAIYALPNADATSYSVTAALQGTAFLVGNSAVDPRVMRPVFGGDILDLYMIGLGATQDPAAFVTDRQFAGAFPIASPIAARIGGQAARVIFAGLTTPGLYLVRVEVPEGLPLGPQPIEVTLGTAPNESKTPAPLTLTIGAPAARTALESARLEPDRIYRLTFDVRTDAPRAVFVRGTPDATAVAATGTWQRYVVYFRAESALPRIEFDLGGQPGALWIENAAIDGP